jgi:hypothetical protein
MGSDEDRRRPSFTSRMTEGAGIVQGITTLIAAGSATISYIKTHGGPIQLLVEIGTLGMACYAATFIVALPGGYLLEMLEKVTARETNSVFSFGFFSALIVLGGVAIRYFLFYPGTTDPSMCDGICTAFLAFLGLLVLLIPIVIALGMLWYRYSSPT